MDGKPLANSTELSVESRPEVILGHSSGQENLAFRNLPENESSHEIPVTVELSNRQALAIRMMGAACCISQTMMVRHCVCANKAFSNMTLIQRLYKIYAANVVIPHNFTKMSTL